MCLFGADLGAITYVDARGRPKVVRYWEMTPPEGADPHAGHEIDDARWVSSTRPATCRRTPTTGRCCAVWRRAPPPGAVTMPALPDPPRNAFARKGWPANEPDELRPMSKTGRDAGETTRRASCRRAVHPARIEPVPAMHPDAEPFADVRGPRRQRPPASLSESEPPAEPKRGSRHRRGRSGCALHAWRIVRGLIDDLIERVSSVPTIRRATQGIGVARGRPGRAGHGLTYLPPFDRSVPVSSRPGRG